MNRVGDIEGDIIIEGDAAAIIEGDAAAIIEGDAAAIIEDDAAPLRDTQHPRVTCADIAKGYNRP